MLGTDIILIEDDSLVGELSRDLLKDAGYTVHLVQNSHDAVPAIKAAMPRLIIADIMLPGVSGLDICKTVKADPALKHINIMVVSGKAYQQDMRRALRLGAAYFLAKPFNKKTYINAVKRIIDGSAHKKEA